MPFYEYLCENCAYQFDLKQGFEDKAIAACPRCKGTARRIFSPVPVLFKGSGFYITDSRQAKDKTAEPCATEQRGKDKPDKKDVAPDSSKT